MTKTVTIENIQKHNKIYDENLKFNETFFKNDVNHVVQYSIIIYIIIFDYKEIQSE